MKKMDYQYNINDILLSIIFYKGVRNEGRHSLQVEAYIHYELNSITLSINLTKQKDIEEDIFTFLNEEITKSDIKITSAMIEGKEIELKLLDKNIRFHTARLVENEAIISADLSGIRYKSEPTTFNSFRLTATANDLQSYINSFNSSEGRFEMHPQKFKFASKEYVLLHDNDRVWIETTEDNVDDLLTLLSFFYAVPIECDIKNVNGEITINRTTWNLGEGKWQNLALNQLYSKDKCYSYFWDYLALVNFNSITNQTSTYIWEYVRSQQLDCISKLCIYCTILAKMANVETNENSYDKISNFLADEHHIDAERINANLANFKIKKTPTKEIHNFYELRNFFVHHIGSEKARLFLYESELLDNLALAINIVILHQLGAVDVRFDYMLKHNCLFDNSVPYSQYISKLFKSVK